MFWKFMASAAAFALLTAGCGVNSAVAPRTVPMGQPTKLTPAAPSTPPGGIKK